MTEEQYEKQSKRTRQIHHILCSVDHDCHASREDGCAFCDSSYDTAERLAKMVAVLSKEDFKIYKNRLMSLPEEVLARFVIYDESSTVSL